MALRVKLLPTMLVSHRGTVSVQAAPLVIQFPANGLGKERKESKLLGPLYPLSKDL